MWNLKLKSKKLFGSDPKVLFFQFCQYHVIPIAQTQKTEVFNAPAVCGIFDALVQKKATINDALRLCFWDIASVKAITILNEFDHFCQHRIWHQTRMFNQFFEWLNEMFHSHCQCAINILCWPNNFFACPFQYRFSICFFFFQINLLEIFHLTIINFSNQQIIWTFIIHLQCTISVKNKIKANSNKTRNRAQ